MSSGALRPGRPMPAAEGLALALVLAARACQAVRAGHSLTPALALGFASREGQHASSTTRAAAQDLAFFTMRQRARADGLVRRLARRPVETASIHELLVICLAVLAHEEPPDAQHDAPTYTPYTLVNQAVEAADYLAPRAAARAVRGFVNAVLRRALTQPAAVMAPTHLSPLELLEETYNFPAWWCQALQRAYPNSWQEILRSGQTPAPLTLRVNRRRASLAEAQARLAQDGLTSTVLGPSALGLSQARRVEAIDGFAQGWYSVQDEAAQRAAPLLDLSDGQRVLDACAAPGGKTGHILELASVDLLALDVDAKRLLRVTENLSRLGLSAKLALGDAAAPGAWWDERPFQRILADLPCSASGIVRRHPDIRWLRRPGDVAALSLRQQHLLDALWRLLAPNGKLLVVTCSIFPQEGVQLAGQFLARHDDARALQAPGQLLPTANARLNHDGLFFSLIEKTV